MSSGTPIRRAEATDILAIARIVNAWIDRTDWMTRVHSAETIEGFIAEAFPAREIYVTGDPIAAYLSLNPETGLIGALYSDMPGAGFGKALMDRAKEGRDALQLNTHEPNAAAQRFYRREGFVVVERNPMGDDGLPELRMAWER